MAVLHNDCMIGTEAVGWFFSVVCDRLSLVHTLGHVSGRLRVMHQYNIISQILEHINMWSQQITSVKCPVPF